MFLSLKNIFLYDISSKLVPKHILSNGVPLKNNSEEGVIISISGISNINSALEISSNLSPIVQYKSILELPQKYIFEIFFNELKTVQKISLFGGLIIILFVDEHNTISSGISLSPIKVSIYLTISFCFWNILIRIN